MNGAEIMLETAAASGVEVCLANPGTTELPLVRALDRVQMIRPVLCLAEAVCAGAADGYARMTRKPALTIVHLGPGLANGLAYFHNARRAATPIVNVVGDHASWHLPADAPLTSDIDALAGSMSRWVKRSTSPEGLGSDMSKAIHQSVRGLATIIAPANYQEQTVVKPIAHSSSLEMTKCSENVVTSTAHALATAGMTGALLLGGRAMSARGLRAAQRISKTTGCTLIHETFPARIERGSDQPAVLRLPYLPPAARDLLGQFSVIALAGARTPVTFFGYEGQPSSLVPRETAQLILAPSPQDAYFDVEDALEALASELNCQRCDVRAEHVDPPSQPTGSLNPETFAAVIAAVQPENAIVVDESVTSGFGYNEASMSSPPHTYLVPHVGGAIGHGLPLATGASIASPDRPVILLEADGSGMYTLQALWTQAREKLNVTTVICANRKYKILQLELGEDVPVPRRSAADMLLSIDRPDLDWVQLAGGLGVPAERVSTADHLASALRKAIDEPGPHLIEAIL